MDQNSMTRSIVEGLVDQYLEQIKRDPKRSIRKLVDLGGQFAKGRFQKKIIGLMQSVLSNEASPYYTFVREMMEHTDSDKIKAFGVNIGFNSWTAGARTIREKEAELGYNIPWSLTFHINDGTFALAPEEVRRLIQEGKNCGIYAYLFRFLPQNPGELPLAAYHAVVQENSDCAFVYYLPPEWVTETFVSETSHFTNLMVSVDSGCAFWEKALVLLQKGRCLFAVHRLFSSREDAEDITKDAWMKRIIARGAAFAFCFSGPHCPREERKAVESYFTKIRAEQRFPVFPMDYYADHLMIDQVISDGPCYMGILPDGTVTMYDGYVEQATKQKVQNQALLDILKLHPRLDGEPPDLG